MTRDEFRIHLAEFLMHDVEEVTDSASLEDLGWDSLALLSVISIVEETWGIEIGEELINSCDSVGDLLNLIPTKLTTEDL